MTIVGGRDDLTVLALSGRLDVAGVQSVESRFSLHAAARRRPTIVDLSQVELLGSSGIGMLVAVARGLRMQGCPLVLVAPAPPVERVLVATALESVLPIARTLDEAFRAVGAAPA
jgi:anti-anti-sigma factor